MTNTIRRSLSLWLAAALWHSCSMAAFAAPEPVRLKPAGEVFAAGPVLIDGAETLSGATFFSGSEVRTGESARAVLSLGTEGRVELMPQSSIQLGFGGGQVASTLGAGGVRLSKPTGVSASIITRDGTVAAGPEESAVFLVKFDEGRTTVEAETGRVTFRFEGKTVEVATGERYTVGQEQPGKADGLTGRQKAVIALGVGGFIALLAILLSGEEEIESPEEVPCEPITLSPTDGIPPCG